MAKVSKIILLIDDDEDDKLIFKDCLENVYPEIECITASNGKEGLEILYNMPSKPIYILLDINMPIMNGFECLVKLNEDSVYASIPVVMYSTSDDSKTKHLARNLGAKHFLTKPASHKDLEKMLRDFLSENVLSD